VSGNRECLHVVRAWAGRGREGGHVRAKGVSRRMCAWMSTRSVGRKASGTKRLSKDQISDKKHRDTFIFFLELKECKHKREGRRPWALKNIMWIPFL